MADIQQLYSLIDQLPREDLDRLSRYIQQRRLTTVWSVDPAAIQELETLLKPVHAQASIMTDEEIEQTLDEALAEVRRERKTQSSD